MNLKISEIQTFCLHDGPGIRTTIFTNGCPLRCIWCHNPETQKRTPQLLFYEEKCIGCGACAGCSQQVHSFTDRHTIDRTRCVLCRSCIKKCPTGALRLSITELSTDKFNALVCEQNRIFGHDGGITFSGGEPLVQGALILSMIDQLPNRKQTHIAMETCGYGDRALFEQMLARMDYVMFDIKLANDTLHRRLTGVPNQPIFDNFEVLRKSGVPYVVRTPLIPGITDTKENLTAIQSMIGSSKWERLPYNSLTPVKYKQLGMEYQLITD